MLNLAEAHLASPAQYGSFIESLNNVEVACFGNCVLDQRKRELRVDGVVRPIAPRVFDVLVYLIANRERVVRKKELVQMHWAGAVGSGSAVSRTIYKARAAIGDPVENPAYIKTIHRVGYRFVGELNESAELSTSRSSQAVQAESAQRPRNAARSMHIALLPFVNRLEGREFDWVDLGLMSLVRRALKPDSRLGFTPTADVLQALERLDTGMTPSAVAEAAQHRLGAECLLSCIVSRSGATFRLDYEGHGPAGKGLSGRVESKELTQLGQKLAGAIIAFVDTKEVRLVPPESKDPFTNQALARALELQATELHSSAALYFSIVLEREPDNHLVRLTALRSIIRTEPANALAMAQRLVQDLADSDNTQLLEAARSALDDAMQEIDGSEQRSRN